MQRKNMMISFAYVTSDDAKKIFDSYYFDTNVE